MKGARIQGTVLQSWSPPYASAVGAGAGAYCGAARGGGGGGGGGRGGFAGQVLAATAGERLAVQALKRRAARRADAADGGAPLVAGLTRAPRPSEASYLLTLLEASNQGEPRDGRTLAHMLEQLGDAALQAALDAFTAADTFRTGRLSSRDFCGMLGKLYAAAGAAPLSPKEAAQLFEQADRHCNGHVCFHEARRPLTSRDCRLATTP